MRIAVFKIKRLLEEFNKINIQPLFLEQEIKDEVADYDILFMPTDSESLESAKILKEKHKKLNLIFVSDTIESCFSAMQMHASGYLLEPVEKENIQNELENIRYGTYSRVSIRCFGKFDVIGDGVSIPFKRKKCKELLAYLISHMGNTISMNELCQFLFNEVSSKKITYLYVLKREIIRTFNQYGISEVIKYQNNGFVADLKLIECDYVQYLEGNTSLYKNKFMSQYEWASHIIENR